MLNILKTVVTIVMKYIEFNKGIVMVPECTSLHKKHEILEKATSPKPNSPKRKQLVNSFHQAITDPTPDNVKKLQQNIVIMEGIETGPAATVIKSIKKALENRTPSDNTFKKNLEQAFDALVDVHPYKAVENKYQLSKKQKRENDDLSSIKQRKKVLKPQKHLLDLPSDMVGAYTHYLSNAELEALIFSSKASSQTFINHADVIMETNPSFIVYMLNNKINTLTGLPGLSDEKDLIVFRKKSCL